MSQAIRRTPVELKLPRFSWRGCLSTTLTLGLLAGLGYLTTLLTQNTSFPIQRVNVEGDFRYLTPGYVQGIVSTSLRGGFFQLDVRVVHRALLEEPWIAEAKIARVWPNALRVNIVEQTPAARWGEHALLNTAADVFAPNVASFPADLPVLSGPVGSEAEVLNKFRAVSALMKPISLHVAAMTLSERGAWSLRFIDGTQLVLGRKRVDERLARFIGAYPGVLAKEWYHLDAIDLRYTNGFALRFKPATTPAILDSPSLARTSSAP